MVLDWTGSKTPHLRTVWEYQRFRPARNQDSFTIDSGANWPWSRLLWRAVRADYHSPYSAEDPLTLMEKRCDLDHELFLHACLLPSLCIIALLSFFERRQKTFSFEDRFPCLRGPIRRRGAT
ncbi:hypothetical protein SRHO_G00248030 [Serrasalmus rhombeus]